MTRRVPILVAAGLAVTAAVVTVAAVAQDKREAKVRADREKVVAAGKWIYDDLPKGIAQARETGKPLLVVLRCIPCEACAKLDEDVVDRDPAVQALLDRFVCVRVPRTNGLDLSLFQFDYDQSWAAFLLNADLAVYGRYGTRTHRTESADDMSLASFAKAMEGALALHAAWPANREALAGKRGAAQEFEAPEAIPQFQGKFRPFLDWDGQVAKSCIHCHMVGEGLRRSYRDAGRPIPERLLFPYPHPRVLGLDLDPAERARVRSVTAGSSAEKDGFRAGDDVAALAGQPILSIADVQWVLHQAGDAKSVDAEVLRDGKPVRVALSLPAGWRRRGDLAWRTSSWDLRRMTTGGMKLEEATDDERKAAGLAADALALRAAHVGQYGDHAVAKRAGFRKGDLIVAFGAETSRRSEAELMTRLVGSTKRGDTLTVKILRDGKPMELPLTMQ